MRSIAVILPRACCFSTAEPLRSMASARRSSKILALPAVVCGSGAAVIGFLLVVP
ncbi:unannotated protein [freshwater metagenome]|uniref:Unannotated protein n=1 Tax=freshwater metagenome TaxID=449393 RepID=A0A6J6R6G0_9ZZZZ